MSTPKNNKKRYKKHFHMINSFDRELIYDKFFISNSTWISCFPVLRYHSYSQFYETIEMRKN